MLRRYVRGDAPDEVLVWYEGSGTSNRRFLLSDERGSIFAVTDSAGAVLAKNSYDEYGIPGSGNLGKFQYTGQMWLQELGMYNYKARIYSPTLGRFLQTDPIGSSDNTNLYAYVGNDPINSVDPQGLQDITITAPAPQPGIGGGTLWLVSSGATGGNGYAVNGGAVPVPPPATPPPRSRPARY